MTLQASNYNSFADELARFTAGREERGLAGDGRLRETLDLLGDVAGLKVLAAGCGDAYLTRVLAARGASVIGVDVGAQLIEPESRAVRPA
jgi:2-polyprenyl-3-methyl-5-hydroxy-6-metoxy-1,4-benzoquinol methylase